ncbi:hypothetical protein ACFVWL_00740 [Microbacterium sp. NPDC058269]|uniref:hypothetical protein n=1 Tax=Microbacterium sp. NPDC058269 TaxID=3346414 RepID=UPI0036D9A6BD
MSDLAARFPIGSAVRAVRFPTTTAVLRSLGGTRLTAEFVVLVDSGQVRLIGWRRSDSLWDFPTADVVAVSCAETSTSPPYPQVGLAIVLTLRTGAGYVDLPIVPVSDDGKRSLTWQDGEVRGLAHRLSTAIEITR